MSDAPFIPGEPVEKVSTKKEFLKLPENRKIHKELNAAAILCYICAGLNLVRGIIMAANTGYIEGVLATIPETVLLLGLGLGIHLAQSRVCAILLMVYSVINMLLALIMFHTFGGYLILIASIFALIYTFKFSKAWKTYNAE